MPAFQTSSPSARPHKAYLPTYISQILISESPLSPLYKSFIVIHDGSDLHPLKKHAMFEMFMWLHIKSNTSDWKKKFSPEGAPPDGEANVTWLHVQHWLCQPFQGWFFTVSTVVTKLHSAFTFSLVKMAQSCHYFIEHLLMISACKRVLGCFHGPDWRAHLHIIVCNIYMFVCMCIHVTLNFVKHT